jgi:hypothetical protein
MNRFFDSPIDASYYTAGAGIAHGIRLLDTSYETGTYRFQLIDADGVVTAGGAVFGHTVDTPAEIAAADQIRAMIAATIPAEL